MAAKDSYSRSRHPYSRPAMGDKGSSIVVVVAGTSNLHIASVNGSFSPSVITLFLFDY